MSDRASTAERQPATSVRELELRLQRTRDRAVTWLLDRIAPGGRPADADRKAGWGRVPWALALSGHVAAASAVVEWAACNALDDDGGFREGPARGTGVMNAYALSHLAIGAWLVERYDVAGRIMRKLETLAHTDTGGITTAMRGPGGGELQDLLMTAQVGIAALVTSRTVLADRAYEWIVSLLKDQLEFPHKLFSFREGRELLTQPPKQVEWLSVSDFRLARQAYYNPGIAAAFLAGYAMQRGRPEAVQSARAYLRFNLEGTTAQFEDRQSVQVCKFGWGASTLLLADPDGGHAPQVFKMAQWFADRQEVDGGWSPSAFLVPQPDSVDRMIKTAEHLMEVSVVLGALGTERARTPEAMK